ncbi:hypothetical protein CGCVW01_v001873 [Colletotrichum viniferum]|nr:hypothetical protein CGCVW01_v001873 [Colletotrichum viniferum]
MFTRGCIHMDVVNRLHGCRRHVVKTADFLWVVTCHPRNMPQKTPDDSRCATKTRRSTIFLSLDHNQTTGIVDSRTAP